MRIATIPAIAFALAIAMFAAGVDERRVDQILAAYDKPESPGPRLRGISDVVLRFPPRHLK